MLALTPSATEAIQGILTAPGVPDSAGLRIVGEPQMNGGLEPVHRPPACRSCSRRLRRRPTTSST